LGGLHVGVSLKRDSPGISIPVEDFIYVWGRVTYLDGFNNERFTDFCHRYNAVNKDTSSKGRYRTNKKHARQHDNWNEFS
jgi:hypothetical protein